MDQRLERVFTYAAPRLKFGAGAVDELGHDVAMLGGRRVLVVTDAGVAAAGHADRAVTALARAGLDAAVYDRVRIEPDDASLDAAVGFARDTGPWDLVVAVGGGSSIDTAKAIALLTSNPGELLDYVNAPIGGGRAPSEPVHPIIAIPTTTGTGSESTSVCVLDVRAERVKTGISHEALRPVLAIVDPELTRTQPPEVVASAGLDVLCHALESWTARPHTDFVARAAAERVPYCGANPISDAWSERALGLLAGALRTAVADPADPDASHDMALAATFAGLGFGNAGVHVPHANGYPIAGLVSEHRHPGYPDDHAMVPHGVSVALTAPAAFRLTYVTAPERHRHVAALLAPHLAEPADPVEALPAALVDLMADIGVPNGLAALGYDEGDVDDLVAGAMQQTRLLAMAPCEIGPDDLAEVFTRSMVLF